MGGFADDVEPRPDAHTLSQTLAGHRLSHIAALNMPARSTALEGNWIAPLLPSMAEQRVWLEEATRQACPDASDEWVLEDRAYADAARRDQTGIHAQTFDDPSQITAALRKAVHSTEAPAKSYRVLNFAGTQPTTALASKLTRLQQESGFSGRASCIGYLPLNVGKLATWPPGWTEILVSPVPRAFIARAESDQTSLWQMLGQTAGQVLVESLAQAGPRLHERSLLEALPSLNGMEIQPGLRLAYSRNR